MAGFLTGRLARMAGTLWLIVTVVFFATRLTGNPIDFLMPEGLDQSSRSAMIAYWGLNRPVFDQYVIFWRALLSGDFGLGLTERRPVGTIFAERVERSAVLLLATLALTVLAGVAAGVLGAVWRGRTRGAAVMAAAFLGYAIPNFVLAILLLLLFSYALHWLPSAGSATAWHYLMPTAALSAYFVASLARYTRDAMLEALSQDYIRTAQAKGLTQARVVLRHGLRNALIPVITVLGLQVTTLVSGAVVIETVFAWNGVGDLLVGATLRRDYPVLQFGVMAVAATVIVVNAAIDLLYAVVDPRVRAGT